MEAEAREHIEEIRRTRFSIGGRPSPQTKVLFRSCKGLTTELAVRQFNFLTELIQNAEDNEYPPGVEPSLEFMMTTRDITGTAAPETLIVFNNEVGFSKQDIESICSIKQSKKKGKRRDGLIGLQDVYDSASSSQKKDVYDSAKGIGFKSVFLISQQPYIFSNGYQIRFSQQASRDCRVQFIVPEWVDTAPTCSDIQNEYGSDKILPTTVIILPLKPDKVETVRRQVFRIHPEILLFSKLRRLSVGQNRNFTFPERTVSSVSIKNDATPIATVSEDGCSWLARLSARSVDNYGSVIYKTCDYYMWKESVPVKPKAMVDEEGFTQKKKKKVDEEGKDEDPMITIAFPFGARVEEETFSSIFSSFLMTREPNLPYIVQSEFVLKPSGEIILDNKWNTGLLDYVPSAFVKAFLSCLRFQEEVPFFSLGRAYEFLPVHRYSSRNSVERIKINAISNSIREHMKELPVVPCESFVGEEKVVYAHHSHVFTVLSGFRELLRRMKEQKVCLKRIRSDNKFILHSSLDTEEYVDVRRFLGVDDNRFDLDLYRDCIQSCNMISQASEEVYVDLICFLADDWDFFRRSTVMFTPILKYVEDKVRRCSFRETTSKGFKLYYAIGSREHAWINKWWSGSGCKNNMFLLPDPTQVALLDHKRSNFLCAWLQIQASVSPTTVRDYSILLVESLSKSSNNDALLLLPYFLHKSWLNNFISEAEVCHICHLMPIIDGCGRVHIDRNETLVPARGSKWAKLFGSNPYTESKCIELGTVYEEISDSDFLSYFLRYTKAVDLDQLDPPDVALAVVSSQLTAEQAFLLLDWLHVLGERGVKLPSNFIGSIKDGKWLKTVSGFRSPNQCFFVHEEVKSTFKEEVKVILCTASIDEQYYEFKIGSYMNELKMIGVRFVL